MHSKLFTKIIAILLLMVFSRWSWQVCQKSRSDYYSDHKKNKSILMFLIHPSNYSLGTSKTIATFLSSYLISDNWKYPKASTSPQLKYPTFVCITSYFPHLHHSVTFWLFLDFSRVLGIFCSFSFTSKLTGS